MNAFEYVSPEYVSNCLIEAVKAKLKDWKHVTIFFCYPGKQQFCHFMWSDTRKQKSYDFSDSSPHDLPWYKCLLFRGCIREFNFEFARQYSELRNGGAVLKRR